MTGIGRFQHTGAAPQTNLASSMLSTDTTFTAASGVGYPDGSVGDFVIAVDPGLPGEEHILCSSRAGAVFTVAGGVAGRGYDNTSASAHTAPTALVEHIVAATEIDDASRHINPTAGTPSDDHLNYALLSGARAFTGGVTVSAGGITVSAGGVTVTGNSTVTGTLAATSTVQATGHIATLTGTNGRFVGTTTGAPGSGTFSTDDFAIDPTNHEIWLCTSGGSPGTWVASGLGRYSGRAYRNTTWSVTPLSGAFVVFNAADYDPSSMFNLSTGVFTAPIGGVWDISACVTVDATAGSAGNYGLVFYDGSGSPILSQGPTFNYPNSSGISAFYSVPLKLAANATVKVFFEGSLGSSLTGAYDGDGISAPKPTWFAAEFRGTTT